MSHSNRFSCWNVLENSLHARFPPVYLQDIYVSTGEPYFPAAFLAMSLWGDNHNVLILIYNYWHSQIPVFPNTWQQQKRFSLPQKVTDKQNPGKCIYLRNKRKYWVMHNVIFITPTNNNKLFAAGTTLYFLFYLYFLLSVCDVTAPHNMAAAMHHLGAVFGISVNDSDAVQKSVWKV